MLYQLRDNCDCSICYTSDKQRKINIFDDPNSSTIETYHSYNDKIFIIWKDSHKSEYNIKNIIFEHNSPKYFQKNYFIKQNENPLTKSIIESYNSQGFVVIDNQNKDMFIKFINELGVFPMKTVYSSPEISNDFWELTTKKTISSDTAYGQAGLDVHTDLTYMSEPPAMMAFNCIENDCEGGESVLMPVKSVINDLEINCPETFKYFQKKQINWFNHTTQYKLEYSAPVLGNIFRYNHYDFKPSDIEFYNYYAKFQKIVKKNEYKIPIKLKPNQTLLINNHEIMHGRNAFVGNRAFFGCYLDTNMVRTILKKFL